MNETPDHRDAVDRTGSALSARTIHTLLNTSDHIGEGWQRLDHQHGPAVGSDHFTAAFGDAVTRVDFVDHDGVRRSVTLPAQAATEPPSRSCSPSTPFTGASNALAGYSAEIAKLLPELKDGSMAARIRDGRKQVDKPGIAARTGAAEATVDFWYLERDRTGFPAKADTDDDGRDWWWLDDIGPFHTAYLAARAASYTRVNRSGDPGDLLTAVEAARVLGYVRRASLTPAFLARPDHTEELPSGRLRRYWYRRSVWAYADTRVQRQTSPGRPAGTVNSNRQPHPYAGDPRLDAAHQLLDQADAAGHSTAGLGTQLARQLDISERAGQRIIKAAQQIRDADT